MSSEVNIKETESNVLKHKSNLVGKKTKKQYFHKTNQKPLLKPFQWRLKSMRMVKKNLIFL